MRWDVLNELLELTTERRFLEIGCQFGNVATRVSAQRRWGVDPNPRGNAPLRYHRFFRGTSDDFFEVTPRDQQFDVVLVDGLHHADQVYRDVENALDHLAPGGTIVLHDCNPQSEIAQRVPRVSGVWNGDCWKAMVALRQRDDLDAFTIDADHGIGVVRRKPNPSPLTGVPETLTYEALAADRARLLGLVSPANWCDRFGPELALGRVVVLTAIFGDRDEPIPAPAQDAEHRMFTDGAGAAPGWLARRFDVPADPRLEARRVKTLALDLVDADVIVWVDGRIRLTGEPLAPLLRRALRTTDIAGFPHPWRSTAAAEARECGKLGLAPRDALDAQVRVYEEDGFPDDVGLWNTMVLARRNTPAMRDFGRAWWAEIQRHTVRDQVSFPYLLWRHGITCGRLGDDVYRDGSSRHFVRGRHRRSAT